MITKDKRPVAGGVAKAAAWSGAPRARFSRSRAPAPVLVAALVLAAMPARAATFTVNSTADAVDANPGDTVCETAPHNGVCTLRAAIQEANALMGADVIVLPAGVYTLTIPGRAEDAAAAGDLDITGDLTITGAGATTTIIQACAAASPDTTCSGIDRVFHVDPFGAGITAAISDVTIQNGQTVGIPFVSAKGGGILLGVANTLGGTIPSGTLRLANSVVQHNNATNGFGAAWGGGIANAGGTLLVLRSTIAANGGWSGGGGIFNDFVGTVSLVFSTVRDNTAGDGGGLSSQGPLMTVVNSTISGNTASSGGGVSVGRGSLHLTNSTISGNHGGGLLLFNDAGGGPHTLNSGTVTANQGNGLSTSHFSIGAGPVTVGNTILAGNSGFDCTGILISAGFNLVQTTAAPFSNPSCILTGDLTGNAMGQDARLGVLADNGGPTRTHALLGNSPAIGTGSPAAPGSGGQSCAATDQRGIPRPQPGGGRCDIGAFELQEFALSGMTPGVAGNDRPLVALIYGNGFLAGATVTLAHGGETVVGHPVTVGEHNTVIAASFDLTAKAAGLWDLVLTNPDGTSLTRAGALTIEEPRASELWVNIVGRDDIRVGRPARIRVLYGNRGNVDALGVPLAIDFLGATASSFLFPIAAPPPQPDQIPTDWNNVPIDAAVGQDDSINVPLLLPIVPAGFTGVLELSFTATPEMHGETLELFAGTGAPYFQPGLDPKAVDDLVEGAREYAESNLHVTIAPEFVPAMKQYATRQIETVVARGRHALVANLGGSTEIYSIAALLIDLAKFGAALPGAR